MDLVNRFISDRRGATVIAFGLSVVPLLGLVGAAVDYGRAAALRAEMQSAADAAAIFLAREAHEGRSHDVQTIVDGILAQTGVPATGVMATDELVGPATVRVTIEGEMKTIFASLVVPSFDVGVAATAQATQTQQPGSTVTNSGISRYRIEQASLSIEAADYNELSVYCYRAATNERVNVLVPRPGLDPDKERFEEADFTRAPDFIKIADNTNEGVASAPRTWEFRCAPGEQLSYRLLNIREARTSPAARRKNQRFIHYADAVLGENGVVSYTTTQREILETIRCETREQCDPRHPDAVVPGNEERNRTPAVNVSACLPGQYMYFGWEDRPPFTGAWTDRDYDDIRVVTTCAAGQPIYEETTTPGSKGPLQVALID